MRREYYSAQKPSADAEPTESRYCAAAACPLPGAISESIKGGGPWLCRFHFGAPAVRWPEITDEAKQAKQAKRDGTLDAPPPPTRTVADMLTRVIRGRA